GSADGTDGRRARPPAARHREIPKGERAAVPVVDRPAVVDDTGGTGAPDRGPVAVDRQRSTGIAVGEGVADDVGGARLEVDRVVGAVPAGVEEGLPERSRPL